jgi:hypothetical protein
VGLGSASGGGTLLLLPTVLLATRRPDCACAIEQVRSMIERQSAAAAASHAGGDSLMKSLRSHMMFDSVNGGSGYNQRRAGDVVLHPNRQAVNSHRFEPTIRKQFGESAGEVSDEAATVN